MPCPTFLLLGIFFLDGSYIPEGKDVFTKYLSATCVVLLKVIWACEIQAHNNFYLLKRSNWRKCFAYFFQKEKLLRSKKKKKCAVVLIFETSFEKYSWHFPSRFCDDIQNQWECLFIKMNFEEKLNKCEFTFSSLISTIVHLPHFMSKGCKHNFFGKINIPNCLPSLQLSFPTFHLHLRHVQTPCAIFLTTHMFIEEVKQG